VAKNKQDFIEKLIDQGVGLAYFCLLSIVLGLFIAAMMAVFLAMAWWDKVR
jgi:ABC-type antimicrobial peptide transport system permease subunit